MAAFIDSIHRPTKTLTDREVSLLLKTTGHHIAGFRDHVLYGLSLATALREFEALALDVGDVLGEDGRVRRRVRLRVFKQSNNDPDAQEVFLNETTRAKVGRLLANRRREEGRLGPDEPVFVSSRGTRLSTRRARSAFAEWQARAGFERRVNYHCLRHTAISSLYRRTLDIRLAQRFARHASLQSTSIYTVPTDDDLVRALQEQPC